MTIRIGEVVRFRPSDVYFPPNPAKIVLELNREIEGQVINFSDSDRQKQVFAEIKIDRVSQTVFVRKDRLKIVRTDTT